MAPSDASLWHGDTLYSVGDWHISPGSGVFAKGDTRLHVEPKLMEVLCCLIQAQGSLVTREALLAQAWPHVVVNEEVLTRAISELRTLLGDVGRERRYIKTVPKRGYVLVMPVTVATPPQLETQPEHSIAATQRQRPDMWAVYLFAGFRKFHQGIITAGMVLTTLLSYNIWSQRDYGQPELTNRVEQQSAPQMLLQRELATLHEFLYASSDTNNSDQPAATPILLAPLSALTDDTRTRAFAAGLTADLRHQLVQQPSFMVVHSGVNEGLAPALILGGNVRIYQQQARVNLQLLETSTYRLLWSSSFEVKLQSPLQAQALIAKRVGIALSNAA